MILQSWVRVAPDTNDEAMVMVALPKARKYERSMEMVVPEDVGGDSTW